MGFRNNQIGYPSDILQTRAIVQKDNFALLVPDGLVRNQIPGFEGCDFTILSSPKLGASFVDYLVSVAPGGKTCDGFGFGGDGIETFVFVLKGSLRAGDGERDYQLESCGYLFVPASHRLSFENNSGETTELFLYKRRYTPLPLCGGQDALGDQCAQAQAAGMSGTASAAGMSGTASAAGMSGTAQSAQSAQSAGTAQAARMPASVVGNTNDLIASNYEGMADVHLYDLLPVGDLAYDLNFHILSFEPGASHGYVETHVQEHGALILEGEGLYNLDNEWIPVRKNDYLFMASYCLQAGYGIGRNSAFSYLYSKDCNRDEEI